jgi:orotidine-5'-phosphate decarboxylase
MIAETQAHLSLQYIVITMNASKIIQVSWYKIGLQLIAPALHMQVAKIAKAAGRKVFLDIKLHDIPKTVENAVQQIARCGLVDMFNMHASAHTDAMREAVAAKGTLIGLAVTVLTSLDDAACSDIYAQRAEAAVSTFARRAKHANMDGIVCSPRELGIFAIAQFSDFLKVTPGIRASDAPPDDQRRTMTAFEAAKAGATHLVIGRPITEARSPADAAKRLNEEIAEGIEASAKIAS